MSISLSNIDKGSNIVLSNNNLTAINSSNTWNTVLSNVGCITGKWYFEIKVNVIGTYGIIVGLINNNKNNLNGYCGLTSDGLGGGGKYGSNPYKYYGGTSSSYGSGMNVNDVIGVKIDLDDSKGTIELLYNNVSQGIMFSDIKTKLGSHFPYFPAISVAYGSQATINFGTTTFTYSIPTGYSIFNTLKYLIQDKNNNLYTYSTQLDKLNNTLSDSVFINKGMSDLTIINNLTPSIKGVYMEDKGSLGAGKLFSVNLESVFKNINSIK